METVSGALAVSHTARACDTRSFAKQISTKSEIQTAYILGRSLSFLRKGADTSWHEGRLLDQDGSPSTRERRYGRSVQHRRSGASSGARLNALPRAVLK